MFKEIQKKKKRRQELIKELKEVRVKLSDLEKKVKVRLNMKEDLKRSWLIIYKHMLKYSLGHTRTYRELIQKLQVISWQ